MNSLNDSIFHNGPRRKDESAVGHPEVVGSGNPTEESSIKGSKLIGSDLTPADYAALEERWIDPRLADRARLGRVDSLTASEIIGRNSGNYAGILIPYFRPGSDQVREYRLRRDQPELECDGAGTLKEKQKYLSPPGRPNMLYLVPNVPVDLLRDVETPLVITEGEFKALALWRLATFGGMDRPRFLPVGVAGVYNWRGTVGKANGPRGERLDVKGPIPDLDWFEWEMRKVVVAYDADASSKEQVRIARNELARHLRLRGARVGVLEWSGDRGKGIDDHLAAVGPDVVLGEISRVEYLAFDWRKELMRSKAVAGQAEGKIHPVLANATTALRHAPEWHGVLAFDEFACRVIAAKPTPWGAVPDGKWTDHQDRLTTEWLQRHGILVPLDIAAQAVQTVAQQRCTHPVRRYLDELRWDGIERLESWLSVYLGVEDSAYSRAVGSRWLISAVARIYRPGAKADCCLILEGPQGSKKSTALRTLAGDYFADELADLGSKDAALQTLGVWIVELSELESLSRSDVGSIKAFMSRSTDRFRPPYGKRLIEAPRQCVFAGSVNHADYLRDETGGRRFWPVRCGRIDVESLQEDRDQLWAEARVRFQAGAVWWLETAELIKVAAQEQAARYEGDPWEEGIARWIEDRDTVSVGEVLQQCVGKPQSQWVQADKNRAARCLHALGWERYRERQGARLAWRYRKAAE